MADLDLSAIVSALFLPLLVWTGSVIAISLLGYPGVICMTPLAWLLALPVGLRVRRESRSLGTKPILEAGVGGAVLGFWQGLLVPAVMAAPTSLPALVTSELPEPLLVALLSLIVSTPVTAAIASVIAAVAERKA